MDRNKDLTHLQSLFPDTDSTFLQELLTFSSLSDAISFLNPTSHSNDSECYPSFEAESLEFGSLSLYQEQKEQCNDEEERPPCRYFQLGQCFRSDCWYPHIREQCRFWLEGGCDRGDECIYSHEDAVEITSSEQTANLEREKVKIEEKRMQDRILERKRQEVEKMRNERKKIQEKKCITEQDFPTLGSTHALLSTPAPTRTFSSTLTSTSSTQPSLSSSSSSSRRAHPLQQFTPQSAPAPYTQSGTHQSHLYTTNRTSAALLTIQRNNLYQLATTAYLTNNKSTATSLSRRARALQEEIDAMHANAADVIFEHNNGGDGWIDLHGLHPGEAVGRVEERMARLRGKGKDVLTCIVGTGAHSLRIGKGGSGGVLYDAIVNYCDANGYRWWNGDKGVVMISMK